MMSLRGAEGDEAISQNRKNQGKDCFAALLRNTIVALNRSLVLARHSGRATRDPESRENHLDSRLRGNDGQGGSPFLLPRLAPALWTTRNDTVQRLLNTLYKDIAGEVGFYAFSPGAEAPGYTAAPDESGLQAPIDGAFLCSPEALAPGGDEAW